MGRNASAVGMMDGAFFVSRTELLAWANQELGLNLSKVEQCASGAVYCQIIDLAHPGTVGMRKLNWMAKSDHEFIPNYKVLQAAFDKNGIQRHIDVDKLIRAKYQDNLEFLQFLKCYCERECHHGLEYDPVRAREGKSLPPWAKSAGDPTSVAARIPVAARTAGEKENHQPMSANRAVANAGQATAATKPAARSTPSKAAPASRRPTPPMAAGRGPCARCAENTQEISELKLLTESLEKERDFYFGKLREVEILVTTLKANMEPTCTVDTLLHDVEGILYADNDDEEHVHSDQLENDEELAMDEPLPAIGAGGYACAA